MPRAPRLNIATCWYRTFNKSILQKFGGFCGKSILLRGLEYWIFLNSDSSDELMIWPGPVSKPLAKRQELNQILIRCSTDTKETKACNTHDHNSISHVWLSGQFCALLFFKSFYLLVDYVCCCCKLKKIMFPCRQRHPKTIINLGTDTQAHKWQKQKLHVPECYYQTFPTKIQYHKRAHEISWEQRARHTGRWYVPFPKWYPWKSK